MEKRTRIGLAAAAVVLALYGTGAAYFRQHSFPNTKVDGVEASYLTPEEAFQRIRKETAEGAVTVSVKDRQYQLPRAEVLSVAGDAPIRQGFAGQNTLLWPLEFFRSHELSSGKNLSFDRVRAEELLEEQGLFQLDIAPVDAKISDYSPESGFTVLPDEDGWRGGRKEIMDAIQEAAVQDALELDLTERFAVKAERSSEDSVLCQLCAEQNALAHHSYILKLGEEERELDGTILSGWLRETRDGGRGLDAAAITAYADALPDQFDAALKTLGAEQGERYIIDTVLFQHILAAKLGVTLPVPETAAQTRAREKSNEKLLKEAQRKAKRAKTPEEAEHILAEAEAELVPEPEMLAVRLSSQEERSAGDADTAQSASGAEQTERYDTICLTDGIYIENMESAEAREERRRKAEKQYGPASRSNALIPDDPEEEAETATPSSAERHILTEEEIYIPVIAADPEFQLGYGLDYIDIDIEKQHVILFENGRKIMESDCVTGTPNRARETHKGVFQINYKQRNRVLRGSQRLYASFVNYWMPFDAGIGLHDATWRGQFGGTIYKSSGSHGCVNLPLSFAKKLYKRVYAGETVYVH